MNKIALIIKREYLTRIRKKSFIVMSILGPLLFAGLIVGPGYLATLEDTEEKTIAVIDSSGLFTNRIPETDNLKFEYLKGTTIKEQQKKFKESNYYAILFISHIIAHTPEGARMYSNKQITFGIKTHITKAIEKELEKHKLRTAGIDEKVLSSIRTNINLKTIQWTDDGGQKERVTELSMAVGYIGGFLIYFFIFLFGSQVMRGVIEEKTNRIIEVVISSVKPFQLMSGKIIGVAFVGLTQFLIWITLTFIMVIAAQKAFFPEIEKTPQNQEIIAHDILNSGGVQASSPETQKQFKVATKAFSALQDLDFGVLIFSFLFFFIGGYLLYGAMFAAIGSAVDNETDTQQFMAPVTIPLILSILIMMNAINTPNGPLAFWFSMIPFTSPIIMMVRIPFGVPDWQVALSMIILTVSFIGTTWLAGKIYRTGILMYGKKVTYKEIWKWIKYHN